MDPAIGIVKGVVVAAGWAYNCVRGAAPAIGASTGGGSAASVTGISTGGWSTTGIGSWSTGAYSA